MGVGCHTYWTLDDDEQVILDEESMFDCIRQQIEEIKEIIEDEKD